MQKVFKWAVALLILNTSCTPKIELQQNYAYNKEMGDSIPYTLAKPRKAEGKLLVFIPPEHESYAFDSTALFKELYRRNYNLLIVKKPKHGDFYQRKMQDFKSQRIDDIVQTVRQLNKQKTISTQKQLVVMGMGEGAYVAPGVSSGIKADSTILIKGGPFSPFFQLEQLSKKPEWTDYEKQYIEKHYDAESKEDFKEMINQVKNGATDDYVLGKYPNLHWLSYNNPFFENEYQRLPGAVFWILFKNDPLYIKRLQGYTNVLSSQRPSKETHFEILSGNGNLQDKEQRQLMDEKLLKILK